MTKEFFESNVTILVELEDEFGGKFRESFNGLQKAKDYISKKCDGEHYFFSDFDYSARQNVAEIGELLRTAQSKMAEYGSLGRAIESLFTAEEEVAVVEETPVVEEVKVEVVEEVKTEDKPKKVWSEDEIRNLLETNNTVLCGALKKLYNQQTADEQADGTTKEHNGVGFNGADSEFLTSAAKFLIKNNYLSDRQIMVVRKKMIKYTKQLTRLANA